MGLLEENKGDKRAERFGDLLLHGRREYSCVRERLHSYKEGN